MKKTTYLILLFIFFITKANSQAVSGYLFLQSAEPYTPVVGTTATAIGDDGFQNAIPITFSFNFGGTNYTTFSISTNGWIRLGNNIGGQSWINTLSNTNGQSPLIAAFWDDHNRNTGSIQYSVSGSSPGRTLEIGWDNINIGNNGNPSATAFGSFKMRLHETSGQIDFVYGSAINLAGGLSASIGLNDLTSFLSVSPQAPVATVSNITANNNITSPQFIVGQKFTFMPQQQCSGIPNPGNSISSLPSVCSDMEFTLSLQNAIPGFAVTYQWEESADGVNFNPIGGATDPTFTASQSSAKTYHCVVTCGNESTASVPVPVLITPASGCYCSPTYTNGKTDGDLISNVVITGTTLSNNTGNAPVNPYYTYFTGQPNYTATLQSGNSYEMSVTVGSYDNQNDAVWIDYNDDAVFSVDERVGYSGMIAAGGTGTFTILLSCDASPGTHRMRVRDAWATLGSTIDPCINYGYGEAEDYDITIVPAPGCTIPDNLGTVVINPNSAELKWQSGCGQLSWDVHITPTGGGLPVGTPSNPNATNTFAATNLQPSTTYDFYVRSNCGANGESDWSAPFTFTTLAPGPVNDDCEAAAVLIPGATFEEHMIVATNAGATKTIGQPAPTCAVFGFGGDVWFSAMVPADGNITIEARPDLGSILIDTGMTVFTGTCGNLTTIGCSDDEGEDAFSMLQLTGLTPGETIYARIWEYANDTFGTFQVSAWNPALKATNFNVDNLEVYPNPVKDILNVSYFDDITNVQIYNLLGQQVFSKTINASQSKIDVTALPKGTYMVKVAAADKIKTVKVIKE
jgi:hypothetical protein